MYDERNIPIEEEWGNYKDDLDTNYAYKIFFGKSIIEATNLILENPIERVDEIRWMPKTIFQYYIIAFAKCLELPESKGESDLASVFLRLLIEKEKDEKGSVGEIFVLLQNQIRYVVDNQDWFEADEHIYGSFLDLENELKILCGVKIGS